MKIDHRSYDRDASAHPEDSRHSQADGKPQNAAKHE